MNSLGGAIRRCRQQKTRLRCERSAPGENDNGRQDGRRRRGDQQGADQPLSVHDLHHLHADHHVRRLRHAGRCLRGAEHCRRMETGARQPRPGFCGGMLGAFVFDISPTDLAVCARWPYAFSCLPASTSSPRRSTRSDRSPSCAFSAASTWATPFPMSWRWFPNTPWRASATRWSRSPGAASRWARCLVALSACRSLPISAGPRSWAAVCCRCAPCRLSHYSAGIDQVLILTPGNGAAVRRDPAVAKPS
jgi:hypothetical protein